MNEYYIFIYIIRFTFKDIILPFLCYPSIAQTAAPNTITTSEQLQYVVNKIMLYVECVIQHYKILVENALHIIVIDLLQY